MNVLVNNGNLGRMGKTTLAYTIYKAAKIPFKYATNDLDNASINLKRFVDGDLIHFLPGDDINIDSDDNIIFDFGGKPDKRLLDVAGYVDVIIVPIAFQSVSELSLTIKNINALLERNTNVVVVVNNTDNADTKLVKMTLAATFPDLVILDISHSKFVRRLANDNKTIFEVAESNKGDKTRLEKKLIPQFNELFNCIKLVY